MPEALRRDDPVDRLGAHVVGQRVGIVHAVPGVDYVKILRVYETDMETGKQEAKPAGTHIQLEPDETIELPVVHEDGDLLIVNKPAGLVVHPAPGHANGTIVNALLARGDTLGGIAGVERPGIVHRLDRDTSGLLMVAKNDVAQASLMAQLKARRVRKT